MENLMGKKRLEEVDPFIWRITEIERARQERKLIMIASESICPKVVLDALASVFNNIYAEGYPSPRFTIYERKKVDEDIDYIMVNYRRYASRRYYK
ncbi:MAG: serine hydroxymethyltransferase, partial [Planctomycetota bacterium]|nr:serine hydroxymethyltransferase [Planctomycetota bacterium]